MIDDTLLRTLQIQLSDIFSRDKRVVAVYLFGSQADGSAHQRSDLDIGIMIDPGFE